MTKLLDGLPKSIRIGPYDIAVIINDKLSDEGDVGSYLHGVSIELRANQYNPVFAVDTVIHEISHGVYRVAGLEKKNSQESVVTAMATGWTQVLRDNPELLKWIAATLKK